jgi:hypothetical protein
MKPRTIAAEIATESVDRLLAVWAIGTDDDDFCVSRKEAEKIIRAAVRRVCRRRGRKIRSRK